VISGVRPCFNTINALPPFVRFSAHEGILFLSQAAGNPDRRHETLAAFHKAFWAPSLKGNVQRQV